MPRLLWAFILTVSFLANVVVAAALGSKPVFPFPIRKDVLPNGLTVVSVPFDSPGIIAYYSIVKAGSRNEVEPGKTGFAHFFEHLMFRGTPTIPNDKFMEILLSFGVDVNAFTDQDFTAFHETGSNSALPEIVRVEADRFQNLDFPIDQFQQEAGAVLGEYEKTAGNPISFIEEALASLVFKRHTYAHTTIGYKSDIIAMPNEYEYSKEFFKRWYRPDNTTILVVGDVNHANLLSLVQKHYGNWKGASPKIEIPTEPMQTEEIRATLTWNRETEPYLVIAYRTPAFNPSSRDSSALQLLWQAAFSGTSPLYQKLVLKENRVEAMWGGPEMSQDPGLFQIIARVRQKSDLARVEKEIHAELNRLANKSLPEKRFEAIKSHVQYSSSMELDTPDDIANRLSRMIAITGDPNNINVLGDTIQATTRADLQRVIKKYFVPENRTVLSLVEGKTTGKTVAQSKPSKKKPRVTAPEEMVGASGRAPVPDGVTVKSPIVSLVLSFRTGSQNDPKGKEGLAAITSRLIIEGGSTKLKYPQFLEKVYPTAAQFDWQIDKELTTFTVNVHEDKAEEFFKLYFDAFTSPRFDNTDFKRVKKDSINYLRTHLRNNDEEELSKWVMRLALYPTSHPYGHTEAGTVASVNKITIADVKSFFKQNFTRKNLTLKIDGGSNPKLKGEIEKMLARLPDTEVAVPSLPAPYQPKNIEVTVVEKDSNTTAISIGLPVDVNRADDDFYRLALVASAFGEHRKFNGRLQKSMRVARGLNYGDYAYAEHFVQEGGSPFPQPNVPLRQQYFSIWIRPVSHQNAVFAIRQAIRELDLLVEKGLKPEEFEAAKKFFLNFSKLYVQTAPRRLGFEIDGTFYGKKSEVEELADRIPKMTLEEVNATIKRRLQSKNLVVAAVSGKGTPLLNNLMGGYPSPVHYGTKNVPNNIIEEDQVIMRYPLEINAERSKTISAGGLFEK